MCEECFQIDTTKDHRFSQDDPVSSCSNAGSISDYPYWNSRENRLNSLELIELSSIL
jgi:hypothetical protein